LVIDDNPGVKDNLVQDLHLSWYKYRHDEIASGARRFLESTPGANSATIDTGKATPDARFASGRGG
jgi:hypothetical protein